MRLLQKILLKILFPNSRPERLEGVKSDVIPTSKELRYKALQKIFTILVSSLNFEQMAQNAVDVMSSELDYIGGVIFIHDKQKKILIPLCFTRTRLISVCATWLNKPFREYVFPIELTNSYIVKTFVEKKVYESSGMRDFLYPIVDMNFIDKVTAFIGIKSSIGIPIIYQGEPIGALWLASIREKASNDEKEMLVTFSDQVAIAIENARFIEKLRNMNTELQDANEHLKELDRMKDDFVSLASHELRTPMTAIKSYLWMALAGQGGPLNEKQTRYIQRSYNSVDRLIRLVNDMLNISRIDSGRLTVEMQAVNIEQVIREVADDVGPKASELGVNIVLENHNLMPDVLADPDKVKEVIYNLVGNSLKFTPKGGVISISINQKDNFVEVAIKDTGGGIAPEELPKLFQKFGILPGTYVTNHPTFGTGLGLYICRSLIDLHGGKIWAASKGKGLGATFTFSLKVFNQDELTTFKEKYDRTAKSNFGLIHKQLP